MVSRRFCLGRGDCARAYGRTNRLPRSSYYCSAGTSPETSRTSRFESFGARKTPQRPRSHSVRLPQTAQRSAPLVRVTNTEAATRLGIEGGRCARGCRSLARQPFRCSRANVAVALFLSLIVKYQQRRRRHVGRSKYL